MCHLQAKNILHRDIAARNILIDGSALKIADLGLSRELFDQVSINVFCSYHPDSYF